MCVFMHACVDRTDHRGRSLQCTSALCCDGVTSFHGCIHNLTLNGDVVGLDRLAVESGGGVNSTRLPVALCPPAAEGPGCEVDVRLCASGPCQNNATCVNSTSSNQFTCLCSPGFTGEPRPNFTQVSTVNAMYSVNSGSSAHCG